MESPQARIIGIEGNRHLCRGGHKDGIAQRAIQPLITDAYDLKHMPMQMPRKRRRESKDLLPEFIADFLG